MASPKFTSLFSALIVATPITIVACTNSSDDGASTQDSALTAYPLQPGSLIGQIAYGQSVDVVYTKTPNVRHLSFVGAAGDRALVSASPQVQFLVLNDKFQRVPEEKWRNGETDKVEGRTADSAVVLPTSGTYYILFWRYFVEPASVHIALGKAATINPAATTNPLADFLSAPGPATLDLQGKLVRREYSCTLDKFDGLCRASPNVGLQACSAAPDQTERPTIRLYKDAAGKVTTDTPAVGVCGAVEDPHLPTRISPGAARYALQRDSAWQCMEDDLALRTNFVLLGNDALALEAVCENEYFYVNADGKNARTNGSWVWNFDFSAAQLPPACAPFPGFTSKLPGGPLEADISVKGTREDRTRPWGGAYDQTKVTRASGSIGCQLDAAHVSIVCSGPVLTDSPNGGVAKGPIANDGKFCARYESPWGADPSISGTVCGYVHPSGIALNSFSATRNYQRHESTTWTWDWAGPDACPSSRWAGSP